MYMRIRNAAIARLSAFPENIDVRMYIKIASAWLSAFPRYVYIYIYTYGFEVLANARQSVRHIPYT